MQGIERIKQLAKDIKNKPLLKVIEYLISREDMNEKYLNEEKTLKQMVDFIRSEAKKQAENGVAMIEDEVVYSWAIHYFDESNADLNLSSSNNIVQSIKLEEKKQQKNVKSRTIESEGQLQLDLFG